MKEIYKRIWELAKPYYEKGRPMDVPHIEWFMEKASIACEKEGVDDTLLLPLAILHDTGYSEVQDKDGCYDLDIRRAHMKAGAEIARRILKRIGYNSEKIEKIVYYVSVHDNWALGDDDVFKNNKVMGVFNDLDYMWMATPKGFPALLKILHKTPAELIDILDKNEKPVKRPFATEYTQKLYEDYMADRKRELDEGKSRESSK
jgi:hypothetical protein